MESEGWLYWGHVHGILMILCWGALLPIGALTAKFARPAATNHSSSSSSSTSGKWWFPVHRALQSSGFVGALIAAITAGYGVHSVGGLRQLDSSRYWHSIFGILIMLVATVQVSCSVRCC
jgi:fructose-specific phosphotransferase system IIC component